LFQALQVLPCVKKESALIVVCGDIFHHKYKLESYSIRLWNIFMNGLTNIAPVVLICGNHDYRQENPENPDLIDVMCECLKTTGKYPYFYFKDTQVYRIENIQFGLVSIKDTLKASSTSGIEENLPVFPTPIFEDCISIALFHGTITQSKLPNGMTMKAGNGYPLEWFKGYSMLLLGDNHKQQVHTSDWGMTWGYPGSLIQQDIGEPLIGHGFLLWDLKSKSATPHHIYNPYGKIKILYKNDKIHVKINPAKKMYSPLDEIVKTSCFPTKPVIFLIGSIADEIHIKAVLKKYNIHPTTLRTTAPTFQDEITDEYADDTRVKNSLKEIATLNNPERWLDYLKSLDPKLAQVVQEKRWMESPSTLKIDSIPVELSKDLHDLTGKVREKIQTLIDIYEKTERTAQSSKHSVTIKHMWWSWVFSYGANNWFNFEKMEGKIALLNGKNASGKSSLIDTLCIGLFGEPTPNRQTNSTRKISSHCIHTARPTGSKGESMSIKVLFTVDSKWYEIHRKYLPSVKDNECKCISVELFTIDIASGTANILHSGTTLVNPWIEKHVGSMNELIKTSIVSQMDSHNFFFAKPEQQKQMIDHAVNLKELDDYSKIIHEAYNGYTNILKMTTHILNTTESNIEDETQQTEMPLLTDEEKSLLIKERSQLETRCKELEASKEKIWQSHPQSPNEILGFSTKTEWENKRVFIEEKIRNYLATFSIPLSSKQDCLIKISVLEHMLNTLEIPDSQNAPTSIETSLDFLRTEEAKQELLWKNHTSLKPILERSKPLLEEEYQKVQEWYQHYQSYLESPDETYIAEKTILDKQWNQWEAEYAEWENHCIEKRGWFSSVPKINSAIAPLSFIHPEMSWLEKREIYHQYLAYYEKIESMKSTLDTVRTPEKEPEWLKRWQEYSDWVSQCKENDWTNLEQLQDNLRKTLEYQEKRRDYEIELERLRDKQQTIEDIFSKYPNWKKERKAWEKIENTYHPNEYTLEFVWTQLAHLKQQPAIWDAEDANYLILQETLVAVKADRDVWCKEHWDKWNTKQQVCLSLGWKSIQDFESYIELCERQLVLLQEKEQLEQAFKSFQQKGSHPDCNVCKGRQMELKKAIQAINKKLDDKNEMTYRELQNKIRKHRKELDSFKWVEDMRPIMESEYNRHLSIVKKHETELKQCLESRTKRPTQAQWKKHKIQEETKWSNIQNYLTHREEKQSLYERLERHQEQYSLLLKKSVKLTQSLNVMLSKEDLTKKESYERNAIDIFITVQRLKDSMETEKISWENARARKIAVEDEMASFTEKLKHPIPTAEELVSCYSAVLAEWESVGLLLEEKKKSLIQQRESIETFERERDEYQLLKLDLEREIQQWDIYYQWEQQNKELEFSYLRSKQQCILKELEEIKQLKKHYEDKEQAESILLWIELQDINQELQTVTEAYRKINERCLQDDSYRSFTSLNTRKQKWEQKYSSLKTYLEKWKEECEWLGKIDKLLVGERGVGIGNKSVNENGHPSTYKEWVYENRVLPILEHHMNSFLSQLGMELTFSIRYKAKALEFFVKDRGNKTTFGASSGFQQFIVGLGMRQALAMIGGSGNNIQHMFIDEGFTACDTENIEKAYDILQLLITQGHYKSILLVSHLDSIKDIITLKIPLERKESSSRLHYGDPYPNYTASMKRYGAPNQSKIINS
jgi:DNA repair exonuclease SbcCD ATPase subunit/DNA repair exonuclease SbcCD nuclease subunit